MSITTTYSGGNSRLTIYLPETFVFSNYREFRSAYQDIPPETRTITLNLEKTEYMDSAALGMLMLLHEHCTDSNRAVEIVNFSDYVRKLLTTTQLAQYFSIS